MKYLFALLSVVFLLGCGATRVAPSPPVPARIEPKEVARTFELTMHVDARLNEAGRTIMQDVADAWASFTEGRVRFHLVFDLTPENVDEHKAVLVGTEEDSRLTAYVDRLLASDNGTPSAATLRAGERVLVVLIVDRIAEESFAGILAHEFGHVAGFPDLPTAGDVMSGAYNDESLASGFTETDRALCRALKYCR